MVRRGALLAVLAFLILAFPDSAAIAARTVAIAAFYNAGGGIVAGSGALNAGGPGAVPFNVGNVPPYPFVATPGAGNVTGPFGRAPVRATLGLPNVDINFSRA